MKPLLPKTARTTLRLPQDLYDQVAAAAKYNGKSLNAEIVERLQAAAMADQFSKIMRELNDIKALDREILEAVSNKRI